VTSRRWTVGAAWLIALLLVSSPCAGAPPTSGVPRVGVLSSATSNPEGQRLLDAFRRGLADLGHAEGRTIAIEYRWADLEYERLPRLAAELIERRVDVILAVNSPALEAARRATTDIPIVTTVLLDPTAVGLAASLARPGGNVTGLSMFAPDVVGKQLELLKQVVPTLSRVALLGNPSNPGTAGQVAAAARAAAASGLRLQQLDARTGNDLDGVFSVMTAGRADGLIVLVDVMLVIERDRIARLAAKHRLPAIYGLSSHVTAGGLVSYGADLADLYRRAATYVDKIVRGARAGELPIEQPTRFELAINMRTARALGLHIPPSVMLRADHVIQP
jgi:putative ABC transport system substrate-binding protein